MARAERLRLQVREAVEAVVESHGFHRRGAVWVREIGSDGDVRGWTRLVVVARGDPVTADAMVGTRSETIERTLSDLRGERRRRRDAPTWSRPLSQLREGTPGMRPSGDPWTFAPGQVIDAVLDDFANAFATAAIPILERTTTHAGLVEAMQSGRIEGDSAWRLPIAHFLRGDAARTREVLEQGTYWALRNESVDSGAYRAFALELLRRLGDAALEPTPSAELVSALRGSLAAAFPDRAGTILAHLIRSFWWEAHPRSPEGEHCALCGATDSETQLLGVRHPRACAECVSACAVLVRDPHAIRARRTGSEDTPSGASPVPPAASLAADAVRALRSTGSDGDARLLPEVERRLLSAPADRPAVDVCIACGPVLPPRGIRLRSCNFCGQGPATGAWYVDAGRVSICGDCISTNLERVRPERRIDE